MKEGCRDAANQTTNNFGSMHDAAYELFPN